MNNSETWTEIYTKTNYNPGWSQPGPDRNIRKIIEDFLKDYPGEEVSVLDIGCGNGRNSLIFNNFSGPAIHYTGIDFSEAAIDYCRNIHSKYKVFIKQNISEPIQPLVIESSLKSFNIVVDCGCFHSILPEKREIYIDNLYKVTQKNTMYILGTWFKKDSNLDLITPRYLPYYYIKEWFFNQADIRFLFQPFFTLQSEILDKSIYPGINEGFMYFILTRND